MSGRFTTTAATPSSIACDPIQLASPVLIEPSCPAAAVVSSGLSFHDMIFNWGTGCCMEAAGDLIIPSHYLGTLLVGTSKRFQYLMAAAAFGQYSDVIIGPGERSKLRLDLIHHILQQSLDSILVLRISAFAASLRTPDKIIPSHGGTKPHLLHFAAWM